MASLFFFQKRSIWRIGLLSPQSNMAPLLSGTVGALEMKDALMSGAGPEIMRLPKIKKTPQRTQNRYQGLFCIKGLSVTFLKAPDFI